MHHYQAKPFLIICTVSILYAVTATRLLAENTMIINAFDHKVCKEIANLLEHDKTCRPYDASIDRNNPKMCAPEDVHNINIGGKSTLAFKEIAINQYGYTYFYKSPIDNRYGFSIIYLNKFNGDRHPRTVETWLINSEELNELLMLPPGPLSQKDQKNRSGFPSRDTRAAEFKEILNRSKKLTNDWSPVIEYEGKLYIIERACTEGWGYGANLYCQDEPKLNIYLLNSDKTMDLYCVISKFNSP